MPPFGADSPPSDAPFGALADPDQAAADAQEQSMAMLESVRGLMEQVDELVGQNPMLAQEGQQIRTILKNAITKIARTGPSQTASSEMVPTGSM